MESSRKAKRFAIDLMVFPTMASIRNHRTLYWNIPGLILLATMAVISGMVVFTKYHDCDPVTLKAIERHDQLMPYYVMDTLSRFPGLPGLFVACVFSGSLRYG